jgi:hypothetical protein
MEPKNLAAEDESLTRQLEREDYLDIRRQLLREKIRLEERLRAVEEEIARTDSLQAPDITRPLVDRRDRLVHALSVVDWRLEAHDQHFRRQDRYGARSAGHAVKP